jgi:predicted nuclease of predicted toxin-antitoxin system
VTNLRLVLDEHINPLLAEILGERGYDAVTVRSVGMPGATDHEILKWAARQDRAILTFNAVDFLRLAREYTKAEWEHAGIVVSDQISLRELLRRTLRLLGRRQSEDLRNSVEWLQSYR